MKIAQSKDRKELVKIVLKGLTGKIKVNGQEYNNVMTPISGLSDADVADVLTYVTNSWGNSAPRFTEEEVKTAKQSL